MIKKALFLVAMTLGLVSAVSADIPFPKCFPCPDGVVDAN